MSRELSTVGRHPTASVRFSEMTALVSNLQLPDLQLSSPRAAVESRVTDLAQEILVAPTHELPAVESRLRGYETSPFVSVNKLGAELRTRLVRTALDMTVGRMPAEHGQLPASGITYQRRAS